MFVKMNYLSRLLTENNDCVMLIRKLYQGIPRSASVRHFNLKATYFSTVEIPLGIYLLNLKQIY